MLFGIDVSHYQEEIDWKRVEASGVKFALLKASEGSDFVDPMFEEYMSGIAQPTSLRAPITSTCPASTR